MDEKKILNALREEFEGGKTTDERRVEIATQVQDMALGRTPDCSYCKKPVIALPYTHPLIKGHIYSKAGEDEFHITRLCEFCFDEVTKEPDEECTCDLMAHPCEIHDCQGGPA